MKDEKDERTAGMVMVYDVLSEKLSKKCYQTISRCYHIKEEMSGVVEEKRLMTDGLQVQSLKYETSILLDLSMEAIYHLGQG